MVAVLKPAPHRGLRIRREKEMGERRVTRVEEKGRKEKRQEKSRESGRKRDGVRWRERTSEKETRGKGGEGDSGGWLCGHDPPALGV